MVEKLGRVNQTLSYLEDRNIKRAHAAYSGIVWPNAGKPSNHERYDGDVNENSIIGKSVW